MPGLPSNNGQIRFSTQPSNVPLPTAASPAFQCFGNGSERRSMSINNDDSRRTWHTSISANGCSIDISMQGNITFNSNGTAIAELERGGYFEATERANGTTHHLEATAQNDGSIRYAYLENGSTVPFEPQGRAWLASFLYGLDRQTGFAAVVRVPVLLKSGGPNAVLQAISQLSGDSARSRYYLVLLREARLDAPTLRRVLQQAGSEMKSDYELSRLLCSIAGNDGPYDLSDQATQTAFISAIDRMKSDYERSRVLCTLLSRTRISTPAVEMALAQTTKMKSDYEKSRVLTSMAEKKLLDRKTQDAYFQAIAAMGSDYERSRSYIAGLNASTLDDNGLVKLIQSVSTMKSDYEKSRVLCMLASRYKLDGAVRDAYIKAASGMSGSERQRVLYAAGVHVAMM